MVEISIVIARWLWWGTGAWESLLLSNASARYIYETYNFLYTSSGWIYMRLCKGNFTDSYKKTIGVDFLERHLRFFLFPPFFTQISWVLSNCQVAPTEFCEDKLSWQLVLNIQSPLPGKLWMLIFSFKLFGDSCSEFSKQIRSDLWKWLTLAIWNRNHVSI